VAVAPSDSDMDSNNTVNRTLIAQPLKEGKRRVMTSLAGVDPG